MEFLQPSAHLLSRLQDVLCCLSEAIKVAFPGLTPDDMLRIAQLKDILPEGDLAALRAWPVHGVLGARGELLRDVSDIKRWKTEAEQFAGASSSLEAFRQFATVERELEPLERKLQEVEAFRDRCVQDEIDGRRGK